MATTSPLSRLLDHPMRLTVTVIAGLAISLSAALPGSAGADALTDAKARATQITGQLAALNNQLGRLDEQYDQAKLNLATANANIVTGQKKLAETNKRLSDDTAQLRTYAVQAYVDGDDAPSLEAVLTSEGNSATERKGYLEAAAGNRQDLIDQLSATRQQANAQLADLNSARDQAAKITDQLASATQQEKATVAQENALQSQVTGQIKTLVAQQQAAQAAAAQAAATKAQAAAAHAAAIAPKATATAPTTAKPGTATRSGSTGSVSAPPGSTTFVPPPGGGAAAAVAAAESQIGVPYVWAGASPGRAFDCSGLTMWAWSQGGVGLPHSAQGQYNMSTHISQSQLQPGDLVFFGTSTGSIEHVGIYVGGGTMVHAPHTGATVTYQSIGYWAGEGMWFGRV
jgi:peptidoglycan DL-endopeptidase CwlO